MIGVRVRSLSRRRNEGESYGAAAGMEVNLKFAIGRIKEATDGEEFSCFLSWNCYRAVNINSARAKGIFS